jgi:hypothetical protein
VILVVLAMSACRPDASTPPNADPPRTYGPDERPHSDAPPNDGSPIRQRKFVGESHDARRATAPHPVAGPPPKDPPPRDRQCLVEFSIPADAKLGRYPSIDVTASPAIPHFGGSQPVVVVEVRSPAGTTEAFEVPLVNPPTCAYCLPAPGSGGCEHSCSWEPYAGGDIGIGRRLKRAGDHSVRLTLRGTRCQAVGTTGVVRVHP